MTKPTKPMTTTIAKLGVLTMLGFAALATTLSGCIIQGDSSGGACLDGAIQAEWVVTASGVTISCQQAGATTVEIVVDNGMTATFDCTAFSGITPTVVGGVSHSVSLDLRDSSGNVLSHVPGGNVGVPCGTTRDIGTTVEFSVTRQ